MNATSKYEQGLQGVSKWQLAPEVMISAFKKGSTEPRVTMATTDIPHYVAVTPHCMLNQPKAEIKGLVILIIRY